MVLTESGQRENRAVAQTQASESCNFPTLSHQNQREAEMMFMRISSLGEVESISDLEITPLPDPFPSPQRGRYCLGCDGNGQICEQCLGTGRTVGAQRPGRKPPVS